MSPKKAIEDSIYKSRELISCENDAVFDNAVSPIYSIDVEI